MFLLLRPVPMIIKDDSPMQPLYHYYWEIKVSHVKYRYASDGWFGVGTEDVNQVDATNLINSSFSRDNFWGYGSNGTISHNNEIKQYGPHFHEGDLLGAHLDLYHGTLEFHRNRKPLGIAFTGIPNNVTLYPILIGATAIPTPCEMDGPHKFAPSLQFSCYQNLAKTMLKEDLLRVVPPGLVHLVHTLNFLHYCTGESANPRQYNFEMVIVSDSEEENWVKKRTRRHKKNINVSGPSSSTLTDSDDGDNWIIMNRKQRWNNASTSRSDEPSCSTTRKQRPQTKQKNPSSCKTKLNNKSPKKQQTLEITKSANNELSQSTTSKQNLSSCEEKLTARSSRERHPLNANESLFLTSTRSAVVVQRKSRRRIKKTGCECLGCC